VISREALPILLDRACRSPILTVTGPRQSGKTTLCRAAFPDKPYASLETPSVLRAAIEDPEAFLARFPTGAILDEAQRAPALFSYLQGIVDDAPQAGRWVLTGSQHFGLLQSITQSLAGRTALIQLLPLSVGELRTVRPMDDPLEAIWLGGYPRAVERGDKAGEWFADYTMTYLERDARQVLEIGDLMAFQTFLGLCAGRTGQLLNLASLGADCGISQPTAKSWLSVLEASYVAFRLPSLHRTVRKRLTKSPKLYFYDTGLLCHLLGIRGTADLREHPLRGSIFENWVVAEVLKWRWNRGLRSELAFYRDQRGAEVDLVVDLPLRPIVAEIKASVTRPMLPARGFEALIDTLGAAPVKPLEVDRRVVYAGSETLQVADTRYVSWRDVGGIDWERPPVGAAAT
jgi:predicted AAA+ superfamily ATPase